MKRFLHSLRCVLFHRWKYCIHTERWFCPHLECWQAIESEERK